MTGNRALIFSFLLLAGIILLFEFTSLDLIVQDHCYDFSKKRWVVDKDDPLPRMVFYELPKYALAPLGLFLLVAAFGPVTWRNRFPLTRRESLFLMSCLIATPILIAIAKHLSGVFCPWDIIRYGGTEPYVHLCERLPPEVAAQGRGGCFPAAHPSGGFALLALYFIPEDKRRRWIGWTVGFLLGWTMGIYQMLKGAHYLSHVLITMVAAWFIILCFARLFRLKPSLTFRHATGGSLLPRATRES